MRVVNISIQGDTIIKQYELSPAQQQGIQRYLQEYIRWIHTIGFKTPATDLYIEGQMLTFHQAYIQGAPPSTREWMAVIDHILRQPEKMPYGLDANPLNFIFNDKDIYFIDFYPLLVSSDREFLSSQFSYDQALIINRYFNKWNVLVCLLNRLKKTDDRAFKACFSSIGRSVIQHLPAISGRDALRLAEATRRSSKSFSSYYTASNQAQRRLDRFELEAVAKELEAYLHLIGAAPDQRQP